MIINNTGKITKDFYSIGNPAIPVYLMDGVRPVIFDAGFAFLGEIYAKEIKNILGSRHPEYLFLTHAHFDHCGSVSILKKYFPSMKVIASEKAKNILGRPNAIKLIKELNQASEQTARDVGVDFNPLDVFESFEVDITVKDEDVIEISDELNIHVIETPGHTSDCLSYYIPEKKILLSSEAAGQPDRSGYIVSDCLLDYDQYYNSMKKLSLLDVKVLCLGHLFVYTNDVAGKYIQESMLECERFRKLVELCLDEEDGDHERVKIRIKKIEYDSNEGPKQPEPAYLLNLEARIKAVEKRMNNNLR